uniref:Interferon regulatory factor 2-binding protein 2-A n=1 Tax=Lygus hesperus TaxID=30085 RepID=A0A0A9WHC3_LYGHE
MELHALSPVLHNTTVFPIGVQYMVRQSVSHAQNEPDSLLDDLDYIDSSRSHSTLDHDSNKYEDDNVTSILSANTKRDAEQDAKMSNRLALNPPPMLSIAPGETCCLDALITPYTLSYYKFTLRMANQIYAAVVDVHEVK